MAQENVWDDVTQYPNALLQAEVHNNPELEIISVKAFGRTKFLPWKECPMPSDCFFDFGDHLKFDPLVAGADPADAHPRYLVWAHHYSGAPRINLARLSIAYKDPSHPYSCESAIYFEASNGHVGVAKVRIPANHHLLSFDLIARPLFDPVQYPWKLCNHNVSGMCTAPGAYTGVGMALLYDADDTQDYAHGFIAQCGNNNSFFIGCRAQLFYAPD